MSTAVHIVETGIDIPIPSLHRVLDLREWARQSLPEAKEAEMIDAGVEELKKRACRDELRQARMEGHAQGRTEGRATLVCRLAGLKFGLETAEQLSQLLEGIADPGRIARVGERIIECETGAELLSRVVRRVPDRDPEREHALLVWEVLKAWVLAGAESRGLGDEVTEEMKRLDERITRICESNEWETGAQLMARAEEG